MGYRSEVEACIYGDADKMTVFLVKHKILNSEAFSEFKEHLKVVEHVVNRTRVLGEDEQGQKQVEQYKVTLKVLHLYGEAWKWYDDYSDVKAWHKLMKNAEEDGLNYEFARIGEEADDIQLERGGEDNEYLIEVYRSTASPFTEY